MTRKSQIIWAIAAVLVAAMFLWIPAPRSSSGSAKEYLTVEEYVEQAQPYLHLSCGRAWEQVDMEADAYLEIVDKVSAITFLNHDLDIEEVYAHSAEDVESLRVAYYTEVGRLCKENPNMLLAGVVEHALLKAFSQIAPEAVDD